VCRARRRHRPWTGANIQIYYGKAGDIATNRRDEAELSVLCPRLLHAAMVYINILMIQDVLDDPAWWAARLGPEDYRGLTALTWAHVAMHGEFKLSMSNRLTLGPSPTS